MIHRDPIRPVPAREQGYTILTVLFLMALISLALAVAAPRMAREIQRDREVETIERGKQYIRAVKMYYKKFSAYPPNVDALAKPSGVNNLRFLRKKYCDPITGKDDWKPIQVGQNKAPTAMGFFGQPLAGTSQGIGAMAGGSIPGASPIGSTSSSTGSGSASSTDSSSSSSSGSAGSAGSTGTTGTAGSTGTTGTTGQTFGGAGVMGFSPASEKTSILIYKTKQKYNQWEFVYDPAADRITTSSGAGSGAKSITGTSSNGPNGTGGGSPSPGLQ